MQVLHLTHSHVSHVTPECYTWHMWVCHV